MIDWVDLMTLTPGCGTMDTDCPSQLNEDGVKEWVFEVCHAPEDMNSSRDLEIQDDLPTSNEPATKTASSQSSDHCATCGVAYKATDKDWMWVRCEYHKRCQTWHPTKCLTWTKKKTPRRSVCVPSARCQLGMKR